MHECLAQILPHFSLSSGFECGNKWTLKVQSHISSKLYTNELIEHSICLTRQEMQAGNLNTLQTEMKERWKRSIREY